MENLYDLKLQNYSIHELEDILGLPPNYNAELLQARGNAMIQNVLADPNCSGAVKAKTSTFIRQAIEQLARFYQHSVAPNSHAIASSVNNLNRTYQTVYNFDKSLHSTPVVNASGAHNVQRESTFPFTTSYPSETFAGVLNPLTRRTIQRNLNIDTRFRENYFATLSSDFQIDVSKLFDECVSMQLSAFEMPGTFYAVSKVFGNNFFVISIEGLDPLTVVVPDGNYDYLSLQNYLNYFLSQQSGLYTNVRFIADINTPDGTGAGGSGKMVVGVDDTYTGPAFQFTLNFATNLVGNPDFNTPLPLKLGWLLGFRQGVYENNNNYVSEGLIDLVGPKYIYLVVDDYQKNTNDGFYSAFNSSILNKNILARISLQGQNFHYLSQNNLSLITTPRRYFGPVNISRLHIQLLDEYGRVLDLNNMDYSFCLTLTSVYDL